MIYELVSERHAAPYKVSRPQDIYGALARYARARNERFFAITLNGAHEITRFTSFRLASQTALLFIPAKSLLLLSRITQ